MDLHLLTSNGLIIESRYYDFNDTASVVSVEITFGLTWLIINRSMIN